MFSRISLWIAYDLLIAFCFCKQNMLLKLKFNTIIFFLILRSRIFILCRPILDFKSLIHCSGLTVVWSAVCKKLWGQWRQTYINWWCPYSWILINNKTNYENLIKLCLRHRNSTDKVKRFGKYFMGWSGWFSGAWQSCILANTHVGSGYFILFGNLGLRWGRASQKDNQMIEPNTSNRQ